MKEKNVSDLLVFGATCTRISKHKIDDFRRVARKNVSNTLTNANASIKENKIFSVILKYFKYCSLYHLYDGPTQEMRRTE